MHRNLYGIWPVQKSRKIFPEQPLSNFSHGRDHCYVRVPPVESVEASLKRCKREKKCLLIFFRKNIFGLQKNPRYYK